MAGRLSRRKMAEYVADRLNVKESAAQALSEVAAYLLETKRMREAELVARDIEQALATKGIVIADVTSAHTLADTLKKNIASLLEAKELHIREAVDPTVLGGVRIDMPGKRLDATLRRRLHALQAKQV